MGMPHSKRWVPKLKAKAVSFAVPLISAVWPFEGEEGATGVDRLLLNGGTEAGMQEALGFHAGGGSPTKLIAPKVIAGAGFSAGALRTDGSSPGAVVEMVADESPAQDAANSFDIQNDLAMETATSSKVISKLSSDTAIAPLPSKPVPSPISNLHNSLDPKISNVDVHQQSQQGFQVVEPQVESNDSYAEQVCNVTAAQDSQEACSLPPDSQPNSTNSLQLQNFIANITMPPVLPLIQTPPHNKSANIANALGVLSQQHTKMPNQVPTSGKRYSVRLAAKKKLSLGRSRDSIAKAQDILIAKLYNSTMKNNQGSLASCSTNEVNHFEQIARLFARPLTKVQMEEIMELANQGKGRKTNNKKGCKVAPFVAPVTLPAMEA
jgi:hypothetical protein